MSVPESMKALVTLARRAAAVEEVPVPGIDDDEVLVKVIAVAQNPTDWKRTSHFLREHWHQLDHFPYRY